MAFHTPHGIRALPAAVELVLVRLPRAVPAACGASATPASRSRRWRDARRAGCSRTAGRWPLRSSWTRWAGAACWALQATSRPSRRSRAGSRCIPTAAATDLEVCHRPEPGPPGLLLERPGRRRAARGRRLLRAPPPRQASRRSSWPAGWACGRALPGELVPPPAPPRRRGRRVLRGRLGGPLLPALGRGHPHRVLLRDRLRPRAACRARRRARARDAGSATATRASAPGTRAPSRRALRLQRLIPALPPRLLTLALRALGRQALVDRSFGWYLDRAHPSFAAAPGRFRRPRGLRTSRRRTRRRATPCRSGRMSSISGSSARPFSVSEYSTRGGTSGKVCALDDRLLLERAKPQREGARGDARQGPLELTEARPAVGEVADHENRPLSADDVRGRADRTGLVDGSACSLGRHCCPV